MKGFRIKIATSSLVILQLVPIDSWANLKVADTPANLGATAADKTPKAVIEVVGNTNGLGVRIPSFSVSPGIDKPLLFTVSDDDAAPNITVGGSLKIGNATLICDQNVAGTMRFDAAQGGLLICDGSHWVGTTPPGTVIATAAETCPSGWLLADGSEYTVEEYPALYAAIGTAYDSSAASGSFKIPDYRGYFLRGLDRTGAVDSESGRSIGSIQSDDVGPHTHTYKAPVATNKLSPEANNKAFSPIINLSNSSTSSTNMYGNNSRLETRPKNIAVQYCIKY